MMPCLTFLFIGPMGRNLHKMRNFFFVKRLKLPFLRKITPNISVSSNLIAVLMIIFHLIVTSIGKVV